MSDKGLGTLFTGMIWLCFQADGNLFSMIDLLKRDTKTLDKAGRQSLRTSKDMPSGPLDLVELLKGPI